MDLVVDAAARQTGYRITEHFLQLSGVCAGCARRGASGGAERALETRSAASCCVLLPRRSGAAGGCRVRPDAAGSQTGSLRVVASTTLSRRHRAARRRRPLHRERRSCPPAPTRTRFEPAPSRPARRRRRRPASSSTAAASKGRCSTRSRRPAATRHVVVASAGPHDADAEARRAASRGRRDRPALLARPRPRGALRAHHPRRLQGRRPGGGAAYDAAAAGYLRRLAAARRLDPPEVAQIPPSRRLAGDRPRQRTATSPTATASVWSAPCCPEPRAATRRAPAASPTSRGHPRHGRPSHLRGRRREPAARPADRRRDGHHRRDDLLDHSLTPAGGVGADLHRHDQVRRAPHHGGAASERRLPGAHRRVAVQPTTGGRRCSDVSLAVPHGAQVAIVGSQRRRQVHPVQEPSSGLAAAARRAACCCTAVRPAAQSDPIAYVPQREEIDWSFPGDRRRRRDDGPLRTPRLAAATQAADRDVVGALPRELDIADLARPRHRRALRRPAAARLPRPRARAGAARAAAGRALHGRRRRAPRRRCSTCSRGCASVASPCSSRRTTWRQPRTRFELVALLNGRLVAYGPPAEVFTPPHISEAFGGQALFLDGMVVIDQCCAGPRRRRRTSTAIRTTARGAADALAHRTVHARVHAARPGRLADRRRAVLGDRLLRRAARHGVPRATPWRTPSCPASPSPTCWAPTCFAGALVAALVVAVGIGLFSRRGAVKEDTAIGILFAAALSLGVVLISTVRSYATDLTHILFGNVLGVTRAATSGSPACSPPAVLVDAAAVLQGVPAGLVRPRARAHARTRARSCCAS